MARGRKPDPDKVVPLVIEGGMPHDERCARLAVELKPDDLSEAEAKIWDRLAPQLAALGRLKSHYVDVVEHIALPWCA